ncbi:hypothetical protein D3C74_313070 [compost metagenome]
MRQIVSTEILNKPGKLTDDEYELIKKHAIYGYELLKETSGSNPSIANVAVADIFMQCHPSNLSYICSGKKIYYNLVN